MRPHGKEGQVQLGPTWCWGDCYAHVEGWGLMLLWTDCLCPRDVAAVVSWCCCGMGVMRQNDGNWQCLIQRNRVQRTRFLCLEIEFIEIGVTMEFQQSFVSTHTTCTSTSTILLMVHHVWAVCNVRSCETLQPNKCSWRQSQSKVWNKRLYGIEISPWAPHAHGF